MMDIMAPCQWIFFGSETPESKLLPYLSGAYSLDICIPILNGTYCYHRKSLVDHCMKLADENAMNLLLHEAFKNLSESSVCDLLKRDTFYAPEIKIFWHAKDWIANNPNANKQVRFN